MYRTAIILCGGKGTRLGQIGKQIPKTLVKIQNKPIIWYIISILKKNAFNHLILPVGYKAKKIKNYIKKNKKSFKNIKIDLIDTGENSTIANRLYMIKDKIFSDSFLLLNGDAIFDFNVKQIFNKHIKKKFDATFLGAKTQLPYGVIKIKNNKIIDFVRDVNFDSVNYSKEKKIISYVYSGICILKKKFMKINFKNFVNFEKAFYPKIIKKKNTSFFNINGTWFSVDNQKDIQSLNSKQNQISYKLIKNIKIKIKK